MIFTDLYTRNTFNFIFHFHCLFLSHAIKKNLKEDHQIELNGMLDNPIVGSLF